MAKFIILKMQDETSLNVQINEFKHINDIAVCEGILDDQLKFFNSLKDARIYQDNHSIDGQCIEVPIY